MRRQRGDRDSSLRRCEPSERSCRLSARPRAARSPSTPPDPATRGTPSPRVGRTGFSFSSRCFPTLALSVSLTNVAEVHWSVQPVRLTVAAAKRWDAWVREPRQGDGAAPNVGEEGAERVGSLGLSLWLPWAPWIPLHRASSRQSSAENVRDQDPRSRDRRDHP